MRRLPGSHVPNIRNRSSKQLGWLCGSGHKPVYRSLSNTALQDLASPKSKDKRDKGDWRAQAELARRDKKRSKREAKV